MVSVIAAILWGNYLRYMRVNHIRAIQYGEHFSDRKCAKPSDMSMHVICKISEYNFLQR